MRLTEQEKKDNYFLRYCCPVKKTYHNVERLIGHIGKFKLTLTFKEFNEENNQVINRDIDCCYLVKNWQDAGNVNVSILDRRPYLDLQIINGEIVAKDVDEVKFNLMGCSICPEELEM